MKKIFSLFAAFAAAASIHAEVVSFASGVANTGSIADEIKANFTINGEGAEWGLKDTLLCINAAEGANFTVAYGDNFEFKFATSNGKEAIIVFKKDYLEVGGKNMELRYFGEAGDVVKYTVAAKGSSKASEFSILPVSSEDDTPTATTESVLSVSTYTSKVDEAETLVFTAADNEMKIKETNNGFRFFQMELPESGVQAVAAHTAAKAAKVLRHGEIIIVRDGVSFDILGARK